MAEISVQRCSLNQMLCKISYWALCYHAQNWEQTGKKKENIKVQ